MPSTVYGFMPTTHPNYININDANGRLYLTHYAIIVSKKEMAICTHGYST